jgi:hypothetical protein
MPASLATLVADPVVRRSENDCRASGSSLGRNKPTKERLTERRSRQRKQPHKHTQPHTTTQPNRQMPIPAVRAARVAAGTLAMRLAWPRHAEKRSMHVRAPARARIGARSAAHPPLRSQRSACRSSTRRASCSSCTFRVRPRFRARARALRPGRRTRVRCCTTVGGRADARAGSSATAARNRYDKNNLQPLNNNPLRWLRRRHQ